MIRTHRPDTGPDDRRCSCGLTTEEHPEAPDRDALAATIYHLHETAPRRSSRAPSRWTDGMWRDYAYAEADRIIGAWYVEDTGLAALQDAYREFEDDAGHVV